MLKMQLLGSWKSISNLKKKKSISFSQVKTRDNPWLMLMQAPVGLQNPCAAVARGLEKLPLPAQGMCWLWVQYGDEKGGVLLKGFILAHVTSCPAFPCCQQEIGITADPHCWLGWGGWESPEAVGGGRLLYISCLLPSSLLKGMDKLANFKGYSNL